MFIQSCGRAARGAEGGELRKWHSEYRDGLLEGYGEEFEGYSGDMAVDDGTLVVKKDLKLEREGVLLQDDVDGIHDDLISLCGGHCRKWGPSVAVRVGGQWVICGAYGD